MCRCPRWFLVLQGDGYGGGDAVVGVEVEEFYARSATLSAGSVERPAERMVFVSMRMTLPNWLMSIIPGVRLMGVVFGSGLGGEVALDVF